jgi:hypothetical protein
MPVLANPVANKAYVKGCYKRTLTGTTANVYANKPWEDLDHAISEFEEFEEDWYLTSPYEFESEYAEWKQSLEDRIERHDAVLQRKDYDIWISKFRKLKQACGRLFSKLKQFMWDDMDRIDRGFVYVMLIYAVVCFVIFY